jgi:hypothetical protein
MEIAFATWRFGTKSYEVFDRLERCLSSSTITAYHVLAAVAVFARP